jgi:hypothetical protein
VHKLDRKGVQGLPKNRYVANIIEKLKSPRPAPVPVQYALYAQYSAPSVSSTGLPPIYPPITQGTAPPLDNYPTTTTTTSTTTTSTSSEAIPVNQPLYPPPFAQNANVETPNFSPSAPPLEELLDPTYATKNQSPRPSHPVSVPPASSPLPPPHAASSQAQNTNNTSSNSNEPGLLGSLWNFFVGPDTKEEAPTIPPPAALYAPFVIHPNQVRTLFNDWVGKLWFAPMEFTQKVSLGNPQAIYVPFWIFSATSNSAYKASVSRYERSSDTKKRTESWHNITGSRNSVHKDLSYCADVTVSRMVLDLLVEFNDWQRSRAAMNQPATVDAHPPRIDKHMDMKQAWGRISQKITIEEREHCFAKCKKEEKAESIENFQLNVTFSDMHSQLIFLPVYYCTFYFESNEYLFLVNAQTGAIQGQRPYCLGKLGEVGKSIGTLFFGKKG